MENPLTDEVRWKRLMNKRMEQSAASVAAELRSRGVEFILFKGWAAGRFYPDEVPRSYVDIDIAVGKKDFPGLEALRNTPGSPLSGFDLHCEFRRLDTLSWEEHLKRSVEVEIEGTPVRIPCPEDHLRIVATHWLNDGGENRERLRDIYYAVANRPADFDWEKCLDCVSPHRRGWVICAVGLAHKYLGLDISDLPFREEALQIPRWVTDTVEREWKHGEPLRPLQTCLRNPKLFFRQLRKRIPPNPIQATIEMEAPIDGRRRTLIQLGNIVQRTAPSVKRIVSAVTRR